MQWGTTLVISRLSVGMEVEECINNLFTSLFASKEDFNNSVFSSLTGLMQWYTIVLIFSISTGSRVKQALHHRGLSRLSIPGFHDNTTKKRFGARSFKCSAPALWNALPPSLKSSTSTESFRSHLKTYLFSKF
nr:hypothetical protein BaRGS_009142 [Batillaria attramentaria]